MNLLPKSSKEFSSKQYWNEFFSKRGMKAFEWYGEYAELCGFFHKYIKPSDKVLVAGCGSSTISADLYKSGIKQITNLDISEIVIKQMTKKYQTGYEGLKWEQGDMFNLKYEADAFSCILDKGTLDALMSENTEKAILDAKRYFKEIIRVLRFGGRYICISLLQKHILDSLLSWFPNNGCCIRFCRCEDAEKTQMENGQLSLPVFVVICTKFIMNPTFKSAIELNLHAGGKPRRVSQEEVETSVASLQEFALVRHNIGSKSVTADENITLDLCDPETSKDRFRLFVVDSPKASNAIPFAVFIVPHGRETEWLFRTKAGQLQLASTAGSNRLIVVHLMRDQIYGTMTDVQAELASNIIELKPAKLKNNYKIPFLSVGADLGERKEVFRGRSKFSGDIVVEDVKGDDADVCFRRLVFLNNRNLVQSEAKLVPEKKTTKRKKTKPGSASPLVLDPSYLACAHHTVMLTSFELASHAASLLLVGLGGGALATYVHRFFPKASLTTVDIDEEIVNVAKRWFDFKTDSRLRSEIADGVEFVTKAAHEGAKYDIIMFDVDSKELSEGLSCPPKQFVERSFLDKVAACLTQNGLFTLNLVCRDVFIKKGVVDDLKSVFPSVVSVSIPEEVNVILFCQQSAASQVSKKSLEHKIIHLNQYLKTKTNTTENTIDLNDVISSFKIL